MKEVKFYYYGENCTVNYDDSEEAIQSVFKKLLDDYYFKHHSFSGEGIMQSDSPQQEAPVILSEIADDILKFKVKWEPKEPKG